VFVGSVMAGILAPVTASRTKFEWHNVRVGSDSDVGPDLN